LREIRADVGLEGVDDVERVSQIPGDASGATVGPARCSMSARPRPRLSSLLRGGHHFNVLANSASMAATLASAKKKPLRRQSEVIPKVN